MEPKSKLCMSESFLAYVRCFWLLVWVIHGRFGSFPFSILLVYGMAGSCIFKTLAQYKKEKMWLVFFPCLG